MDLESITAVNNGLIDFKGILLFASHDHQFVQTIANRIIEITDEGIIDRMTTFDEYLEAMGKKLTEKWAVKTARFFYDINREFLTKVGFYFGYHKEDKTLHYYG